MPYTHKQKRVAYHIYSVGRKKGASRKELLSALETALTEANLGNPNYGDGTSQGWRQQISGAGVKSKNRQNVRKQAGYYFDETKAAGRGRGRSAGQLAQSVQRSAYPGRYDQRGSQAKDLLNWLDKKYGGKGAAPSGGGGKTTTKTVTPGVDNSGARRDAKLAYLANRGHPDALLNLATSLRSARDVPSKTTTKVVRRKGKVKVKAGKDGIPRGASAKGTKVFEGVRVAAWIHPYLVYGRKHGWKGKVNSGFRTRAEQTRIYNSGVRPAARPGSSNHEGSDFPRGAVDVSDASGLSRILRRRGTKKLRFAGAKDPVHFSHPHGGSY